MAPAPSLRSRLHGRADPGHRANPYARPVVEFRQSAPPTAGRRPSGPSARKRKSFSDVARAEHHPHLRSTSGSTLGPRFRSVRFSQPENAARVKVAPRARASTSARGDCILVRTAVRSFAVSRGHRRNDAEYERRTSSVPPRMVGLDSPSLDVPEETVKWHLKIQFGKLNAGARSAVDRSRLLGLVS